MTIKNSSEENISKYDTRSDLGYGRSSSKFHKPRVQGSSYPYITKDVEQEDFEHDESTQASVQKKKSKFNVNDFLAARGSDPFYFAAGNTKLSDCFYRFEKVIVEVESFGDSMSPIRSPRKSSGLGSGASSYIKTGNYKKTGTKRGFASPPPPTRVDDDGPDEEFYDLFDFSEILKRSLGE